MQQPRPLTDPSLEAQPWWSRSTEQGKDLESSADLRWPWLRAEPTNEPPSVNPDGSGHRSELDKFNPLSFAYQPFDQMPAENFAADGTAQPQVGAAPTLNPSEQPAAGDGLAAASMALPAAPAVASSKAVGAVLAEAARATLAEAAALAGRLAPAAAVAARAASGPAAALSVLVTPTNSQGETIELGDGLRARTSTGQRSVKIERRADTGLLGTGFGARWEALPVDAELRVEEGGATSVLIDHQQLQAAVGPEATARALDAIEMARPPNKGEGGSRPQANTAKQSKNAPTPDGDRKPPNWASIAESTAAVAAKIWEHVNRPRTEAEDEAQIVQACRSVMRARGEQTPDKQYRGEHGYDTAVGVRMARELPDPTPGRHFSPTDPNHLKGYIGELELGNLVHAQGDHFVVHVGNPPGIHGPDVLSIGRDGRFMGWDSKARSAQRSVGESMAASGSLDRQQLQAYVEREIKSGRLPPELGYHALNEFYVGNYNVCTVGTANAHNGYVEIVRGRRSNGPRRP